ncbi:type II secretion system F family protein [Micromonospora schwarzwaldensis]
MTGQLGLVVVLLAGAAVTVGWPVRGGRARQRAVLDPGPRAGERSTPERRATPTSGGRDAFRAVSVRRALPAAALLGGGAGALLGGPVAALVLAVYGTLAARAALRRRTRQAVERDHRRDLDRLGAVAADLRAGLPAGHLLDDGAGRIARLARAAVRLADRTGAPLADLLERIEADARAADRGLAAAAAQAAGARATAWLLAALPLGGIGLGYAIGVDPVAVLLHTPVGGGSALGAVVLQVGGLLWAERLGAGPGRAA